MTERCIWLGSGRIAGQQVRRSWICLKPPREKVALFGTCGMGNVPEYYDRILNGVAAFIPEDCEYLGGFLCQGKMPIQVRKRYEAMQNTSNTQQVEMLLHNFDEALLHPDRQDLKAVADFVKGLF